MKKVGKTIVPRTPMVVIAKLARGAWHKDKTKPHRHPKHKKNKADNADEQPRPQFFMNDTINV